MLTRRRRGSASASSSPTPTASASSSSAPPIEGEDGSAELRGGRAGRGQRRASRTRWRPGRYFVHCGVNRDQRQRGVALYVHNAVDFVVFGGDAQSARRSSRSTHEIEAVVEDGGAGERDAGDDGRRAARGRAARPRSAAAARRFFDLLWLMSVTEFKRIYFGTVLGYLWSLIRPLMLFGVLLFVFTKVFKVGSERPTTTRCCCCSASSSSPSSRKRRTNAVTSVVAQEGVVRKTQFPRLVIPLVDRRSPASSTSASTCRRLRLHPRLRGRPDLDLAAVPARRWLLLFVLDRGGRRCCSRRSTCASATSRSSGPSSRQMLFYATPILYPIEKPA